MALKKALVCGAGGFIGSHMVKRLRAEGYWVRGADLKYPDFSESQANEFVVADLRLRESWRQSSMKAWMRCINSPRTWAALDISLLALTMPMLCITPR